MEASTLTTQATRAGLLGRRRAPALRLQKDERLIALIRSGNDRAFETLFERYQPRLLAFCRSMLRSTEDAEDVLQDVFVNAHAAILQDNRKINARPWLYRIARNRCLNHLRKPTADGQDTMDDRPHLNGTTTAERVHQREELRELLDDVENLPETQRSALLLREIDQLSYDEIAVAMDTTMPSVKSLLVRARMGLAESSQARALSCDEVRLDLAEASEGISKLAGPARRHVRDCEDCGEFRSQLRSDRKALAALAPFGPLLFLKQIFVAKLGGGAAGGVATSSGLSTAGSAASSIGAISSGAAASGTAMGAVGGAIGTKAAAGVATAAILTAGAGAMRTSLSEESAGGSAPIAKTYMVPPIQEGSDAGERKRLKIKLPSGAQLTATAAAPLTPDEILALAAADTAAAASDEAVAPVERADGEASTGSEGEGSIATSSGSAGSGGEDDRTVVAATDSSGSSPDSTTDSTTEPGPDDPDSSGDAGTGEGQTSDDESPAGDDPAAPAETSSEGPSDGEAEAGPADRPAEADPATS